MFSVKVKERYREIIELCLFIFNSFDGNLIDAYLIATRARSPPGKESHRKKCLSKKIHQENVSPQKIPHKKKPTEKNTEKKSPRRKSSPLNKIPYRSQFVAPLSLQF